MNQKRIKLDDLEGRYSNFCAMMHGVKDIPRGTYNDKGQVKGPAHE